MSDGNWQDHDLPARLSRPAMDALLAPGYTRMQQLTTVTAEEILALHGMGPKGIRILQEALAEQGKTFQGEGG